MRVSKERLEIFSSEFNSKDIQDLASDINELRYCLNEACIVIEGLADQQAMPDDFYKAPLAHYKKLLSE